MFLLNSCLSLFSAASSQRRPFSRSYGAILPSSLTTLLPPALGFSPHPPVSVYGTGAHSSIAAFLGGWNQALRYSCSLRVTPLACRAVFPSRRLLRLPRSLLSRAALSLRVPTVLTARSAGISTCCPSATRLRLALGPDFPRADQLYSGNLGYSAWRIPTSISLLIPAFSLLTAPLPLPVLLLRCKNAPLPLMLRMSPWLRRRVSAPDIFGAGPLDQ